jgi:flagellin-like protein
MKLNNRRGVSPVVATVLLILITIAGISIIAGVLIPFISNNLETSTACIEYRNYYEFSSDFSFNCYKEYSTPAANGHAITLRAGSDSEVGEGIKGFEMIFLKEGSSKKIVVLNGSQVSALAGVQMLGGGSIFEIPQPGEIRTYIINDSSLYTGVEVYPVLVSEKVCDLSDSVILHLCPDGTNI